MADAGHDGTRIGTGKKGGRAKLLAIGALVAVVIGGGGAGAYVSGVLDGVLGDEEPVADLSADEGAGPSGETGHGGSAQDAGHGDTAGDTGADAHGGDGGGAATAAAGKYYDLPEFIVNMNTSGERRRFLRLRAQLDVADPVAIKHLDAQMPRIVDGFQVFLRELRPSDIAGSAGTFRLREELIRRINVEIAPSSVDNLLFVELVVQ